MTNNLFPLPYWAPALRRVPMPLQLLNAAYACGEQARRSASWHEGDATRIPSCEREFKPAKRYGRYFPSNFFC